MKTLVYFIIALGLLEMVSNLYHLLKGNKESIGLSAKKQHQELSLDLGYRHFYMKAILMFVFGCLFTASGFIALFNNSHEFFGAVLGLFALYGIAQAVYYKRPYKVWMSLVVYVLPLIVLLFLSGKAEGETAQNSENHPIESQFVFPFILGVEPIKRLLVIDFKDDSEYETIEPQFYNDSIFGKGLRVLLYRTDKKIDVYYQPGVSFDRNDFKVGKGLGNAVETQMSPSKFEITETGVDIDIAFSDYKGRRIELLVKENSTNKKPFPFLAPVGKDVEKPSKLFLVYMQEFDFVKREGTKIQTKVDERKLVPATFPLKLNRKKVFFARYASNPRIGIINSEGLTINTFNNLKTGNNKVGMHNILLSHDQKVTDYWIECGSDTLKMTFKGGFPNLLTLPHNQQVSGEWDYTVSNTQITGGTYSLMRKDDRVTVSLDVSKKWKPINLPFNFSVFTYFVRSFRTWPTTYKWTGVINLKDMSLQGQWQRK